MTRQLDKGGRGDNAWPLWGLVMRLIQAVSISLVVQGGIRADWVYRWACTETATAGISRKMSSRKDARYSGNAILPILSKHIVSQDRMYLQPYMSKSLRQSLNRTDQLSTQSTAIQRFPQSRLGRTAIRAIQFCGLSCLKSRLSKTIV